MSPTPAKNATSGRSQQNGQILTHVLMLLSQNPPNRITFSRISKAAKVPRSTLYYHFGNSVKAVIERAVQYGMSKFVLLYEFDRPASHENWKSFQKQRLLDAVALVRKYPWAPSLYFRYRVDAGPYGEQIREIEDNYCLKLSKAWERFHGKPAEYRSIRMASYLKLGFLWGLSLDHEVWNPPDFDRLISRTTDDFTDVITQVLKLKGSE